MSLSNINNGLVFAASPTLPEYPDNVAGTTYFQDAWATVDGWVTEGGFSTLSVSGGLLKSTVNPGQTFNRAARTFAIGTLKTYRIRIRSSATKTTLVRVTRGGTTDQDIITAQTLVAGVWTVIDAYEPLNVTKIYIQQISVTEGDFFEVDWIYIGDGTYSSRLLDASGNGNHGTVFGATPTADGGLSFDGVNDYLQLASAAMPAIFCISMILNNAILAQEQHLYIHGGFGASNQFSFRRLNNTNDLRITYDSGGSAAGINVGSGFFAGLDNTNIWLAMIVNFATNTVLTYRNGVLFATTTLTNSVRPTTTVRYIGSTSATGWYKGTIRDPRIYNRALTAAEIEALATNPDAYNLDRVVRSVTPVPTSVMTRDINSDTQVRRLESTIATGTAPLTVASTTLVTNLNADRVDSLEGSDFVRGTGTVAQTITGVKTFSAIPVLPASDPTTVNQATRKAYIDGKLPGKITISASAPTGGTDGDIWITV
jgi:hypothetical protein